MSLALSAPSRMKKVTQKPKMVRVVRTKVRKVAKTPKMPSSRKLLQKKSPKTRSPHPPLLCRSTLWAIKALRLLKMLILVRKRMKITSKNHLTTSPSLCRLSATSAQVKTYSRVRRLSAKRSCVSSKSTPY